MISADALYQGHYDGVIRNYRESHVSSWQEIAHPILGKLLALMPGNPTLGSVQTHALHLASSGEILPHVDNVEASGGVWDLPHSVPRAAN